MLNYINMFYTVFRMPNYNYYVEECFNNQNYGHTLNLSAIKTPYYNSALFQIA